MPGPPRENESSEKPRPSRKRWAWYGGGLVLALVILALVRWVLAVRSQAPSPAIEPDQQTEASPPPAPKESLPERSEQSAPPEPGAGGGGGGTAEAPPPPPPPVVLPVPRPQPEPAPPTTFPEFPWPPPRASAGVVLPAGFLRRPVDTVLRWGDVDHTLISALDSCGYFDRSYYAVPDGFAIVTRLEQMEADGTSKTPPDRWALEYRPLATFSLSSYLRALFTANPGFYRIIVFVVTSQSFSESPTGVSREEAMEWLQSGLDRLPAELAGREFTDQYACTALIYQFEQPGSGEGARLDVPSDLPGRIHLERAKLWEALGKPAIGY